MSDHLGGRKAVLPVIARNLCTGCGWCVAACPDHLLVLEVDGQHRKAAELPRPDLCPGCGKCIPACNFRAIRMARRVGEVAAGRG